MHTLRPLIVVALGGLVLPGSTSLHASEGQEAERMAAVPRQAADAERFWTEGSRLRDQGRWEEALELWEEARDELAIRDLGDPRIGAAYAEMVAGREMEDRYATASEMVLWGLSGRPVEGAGDALVRELDRVLLIVGDGERERLEPLRTADPRDLALALKRFWIERDPSPNTRLNERLMEHWSRIAEARRRFVYNRSSPFGTDDRGVVFLKYGEPERIKKGSLGASEHELQIRTPRNPDGAANIRRYDTNPQYEVWVYDSLNDEGFTYFLFGNVGGTGPFELVKGLHDLIPTASKSRASARYTPGGVPVSFYLELFYYQDLSAVGGHFGDRFSQLDQLWNLYTERRRSFRSAGRASPRETELEALSYRWRQEDEFFPPTPPTTPALSAFEGRARDEVVAQVVRTLSDDDVPLLVTLIASSPRLSVADPGSVYEQRLEIPGWVMRHSLIIRDQELDEVGRLENPVDPRRADISTFVLRHVPEPLHLTVTARTYQESDSTGEIVESDRLPAQAHFAPGEPLITDRDVFEMSDIVTGTPVPRDVDASGLPYPLLPTTRIWRRDPLRVYLELYHLGPAPDGGHRASADFRVVPLDEDGVVDGDREPVTLSVDLTSERPTYRQFFDIALRDQEPGTYRLEVTVRDEVRNQARSRSVLLELAN